jgi:hypothetical protein
MQELTKFYTQTERDLIQNELERLFVFQDKAAGARKITMFMDEIFGLNFPIEAILAGIKDLQHDSLQHIKLGTIIDSIQTKIHIEETTAAPQCNYCTGADMVSLRNDKGYTAVFACLCARGDHFQRTMNIARWNGRLVQKNGERIYKVEQPSLREIITERINNATNTAPY